MMTKFKKRCSCGAKVNAFANNKCAKCGEQIELIKD